MPRGAEKTFWNNKSDYKNFNIYLLKMAIVYKLVCKNASKNTGIGFLDFSLGFW